MRVTKIIVYGKQKQIDKSNSHKREKAIVISKTRIGIVSCEDKRDLETTTKGLVEHHPCLEGRDKREPRAERNRKKYEHAHSCIIQPCK